MAPKLARPSLPEVQLDRAVRRLVDALHPEAIYLYGSHAYGEPHFDSDVDLLVVVEQSTMPAYRRGAMAYRALRGMRFPADVKVVTREELRERLQWQSSVEREAVEMGRLVFDAKS